MTHSTIPTTAIPTTAREIRITLLEREPPVGWLTVGADSDDLPGATEVRFEGWLNLMHALTDAFTSASAPDSVGR